MKKILCLLMLFCSLSAFATNYSGKLDVTVSGSVTTTDPQEISTVINGDVATITIYDFWYGWMPVGDVTITAKIDANKNLSAPVTVNIIGMSVTVSSIAGTLGDTACNISMAMSDSTDSITIDYVGSVIP